MRCIERILIFSQNCTEQTSDLLIIEDTVIQCNQVVVYVLRQNPLACDKITMMERSDIHSTIVVQFSNIRFLCNLDRFSLERREAVAAMIAFHQRTRHLDKDKHEKKREKKTITSDADAEAITIEPESDEDNDKTTEEAAESETCSLLEKYEEITLYGDGAPEETAQKRVDKLFEDWSKEDDWHYLKVYDEFTKMYPRVTTGKPWVPWVSDSLLKEKNVLKKNVPPPESV